MVNKFLLIAILPIVCSEFPKREEFITAINSHEHVSPEESNAIKKSEIFFHAVFKKIESVQKKNPILLFDLDHTVTNAAYEITFMAAQIRRNTFGFTWGEVDEIFAFSKADKTCQDRLKEYSGMIEVLERIRTEASIHAKNELFSVENLKYEVARWSKDAYYAIRPVPACSFLKTTLAARLRTKLGDKDIGKLEKDVLRYSSEHGHSNDEAFDGHTLTKNKDVYQGKNPGEKGEIRSIIKVYDEQFLLINALKEVHATPYLSSASQEDFVKRAVKTLKPPIAVENAYGTVVVGSEKIIIGEGTSNDGEQKVKTVVTGMGKSDNFDKVLFAAGDTDSDAAMMKVALKNDGYALIIQNGDKLSKDLLALATKEETKSRVLVQRVNEARGKWVYSHKAMGLEP